MALLTILGAGLIFIGEKAGIVVITMGFFGFILAFAPVGGGPQ